MDGGTDERDQGDDAPQKRNAYFSKHRPLAIVAFMVETAEALQRRGADSDIKKIGIPFADFYAIKDNPLGYGWLAHKVIESALGDAVEMGLVEKKSLTYYLTQKGVDAYLCDVQAECHLYHERHSRPAKRRWADIIDSEFKFNLAGTGSDGPKDGASYVSRAKKNDISRKPSLN